MSLTLRPATADDLPAIIELEGREQMRAFIGMWPHERYMTVLKPGGPMELFVYEDADGRFVGFTVLEDWREKEEALYIFRLAVTEPGSGKGQIVLNLIEELARSRDLYQAIMLDVFTDNERARRVYLRYGFETVKTLFLKEFGREAYLMHKAL